MPEGGAQKAMGAYAQYTDAGTELIGGVTKINGIELAASSIDTTELTAPDGYWQGIQGLRNAGEFSIEGNYHTGSAGQAALYAQYHLDTAGGNRTLKMVIMNGAIEGASLEFTGHITKLKPLGDADVDGKIAFACTWKVTGKPTYNAVA